MMVKDTIDIAGFATRAGSQALENAAAAQEHAQVVEALLAGNCRILGKTSLHELAFGTTGINHWSGTADNPLYPGLIPGGSSSGSAAAVAAGLVDFALGTDTGGSVRVPAACCGVFGLKPTFGRISRAGVMPGVSSLDCVGPFAASMELLIAAMQVIDPGFVPSPAHPISASAWCPSRRTRRSCKPSTRHWPAAVLPCTQRRCLAWRRPTTRAWP